MEDLTKFTVENARHIVDMLISPDAETVELAMRTLPGMDYKNYPHIYKFILDATLDNWWGNPRLRTNPEATDVARAINWHHNEQQLKCLYPCEIEIARTLIEDHVNREVNRFLTDTKFKATVTIDYYES